MTASQRISRMLQDLFVWIGVTPWLLVILASMFVMAGKSRGDELSASVKIVNGNSSFSGTLLEPFDELGEKHYPILTCGHGFRGVIDGEFTVVIRGKQYTAKLRWIDHDIDVAGGDIRTDDKLDTVPLADNPPTAYTRATSIGYPHGEGPKFVRTTVETTDRWFKVRGHSEYTTQSLACRGHSGGGLIVDGRLAGVVTGGFSRHDGTLDTDGKERTHYVPLTALRSAHKGILDRLRQRC